VRVRRRPLAHGEDTDAGLGELDCRSQPGPTGSDHEDGGGEAML
jgi:hypothetical protein